MDLKNAPRRQASFALSPRKFRTASLWIALATVLPPVIGSGWGMTLPTGGSIARLPLMFEQAEGVEADFFCRGPGYQLWLKPTEAALILHRSGNENPGANDSGMESGTRNGYRAAVRSESFAAPSAVLRLQFVNARADAAATGTERLATRVNYFIGNDPAKWRRDVPVFGKVRYAEVYPGIDAVYYGNQRQLEYDFVVAPGADPGQIALRFEGMTGAEISADGDLVLHTPGGPVVQRRPFIYQEVDGERRMVEGRYRLRESRIPHLESRIPHPGSRNVEFKVQGSRFKVQGPTSKVRGSEEGRVIVAFEVAAYDVTRPLVIDPILVYSTYLGGSAFEKAWDIAVDAAGNAYVAGEVTSTNFPVNGALISTNRGGTDGFVAKVDATGTNLVYATYLGGQGTDVIFDADVDAAGNAYLTGSTASTNFPVTANAFATNLNSGAFFGFFTNDAFVAKLDAAGTNLLYSTYLGGSDRDQGIAIAVDGGGNVYVTGDTLSADFPTNSVSPAFGGGHDVFVVKLTAADTNLVYSVFLGGNGNDFGEGIGVDASGNAIVGGSTDSTNFPTVNALQTNFLFGAQDGFVTRLSADGATMLYSTYLGGSSQESVLRVASDAAGNAYLVGFTYSTNFPTRNALAAAHSGFKDVFVTKLDPGGTNIVYSTFLGGSFDEEGWGIAINTNGNAYVAGITTSTNFPVVNPLQAALNGGSDAFVARLNAAGTALEFSTLLGGSFTDEAFGVAVDNDGNAFVAGWTVSTDFPTAPGTNALQAVHGGGTADAFVTRIFPRDAELRAERSGASDVTIFWPRGLPQPGYELQSKADLNVTNNWTTVTNTPSVSGEDNSVTFPNVTGQQYFRLRQNN